MGGMERIKGERSEQQSDKAENHHQHGVNSGRFEVQKLRFLIKDALYLYTELRFLPRRGTDFHEIHDKTWPGNGKWSREKLYGKENAYMNGLDGAENRTC